VKPARILLDNTVLSNFGLVEQISILQGVFGRHAATVAEVVIEYDRGAVLGRLPKMDWNWLAVLRMMPEEQALYRTFLRRLDAGEASCLAVAYTRTLSVATDDRDARQVAVQYGIPKTGTIGILIEAVRRDVLHLASANELLQRMIAQGYRSPVGKLNSLL
jgi:predicted nucleic acid-binding protein